jgi:hypothetical protein
MKHLMCGVFARAIQAALFSLSLSLSHDEIAL